MKNIHTLHKITCFITHSKKGQKELLLFQHPQTGIQIPTGTVEITETFEKAALRETIEEIGITDFYKCTYIGDQKLELDNSYVIF